MPGVHVAASPHGTEGKANAVLQGGGRLLVLPMQVSGMTGAPGQTTQKGWWKIYTSSAESGIVSPYSFISHVFSRWPQTEADSSVEWLPGGPNSRYPC